MLKTLFYVFIAIVILLISRGVYVKMRDIKYSRTYKQLYQFSGDILFYGAYNGKIHEGTFKELSDAISKWPGTNQKDFSKLELIKAGRDAWGRPFIYELKKDGYLVIIRSVGGNGRDDGGQGDDAQRIIDLMWVKKMNEENPSSCPTTQKNIIEEKVKK